MSNRTRWALGVAVFIAIAAFGYLLWTLFEAGSRFNREADAIGLTSELAEQYLESNSFSRWPESWAALEALSPMHPTAHRFRWPQDAALVREMVYVDFSASVQQLKDVPEGKFMAIRLIQFNPELQKATDHLARSIKRRVPPEGDGSSSFGGGVPSEDAK